MPTEGHRHVFPALLSAPPRAWSLSAGLCLAFGLAGCAAWPPVPVEPPAPVPAPAPVAAVPPPPVTIYVPVVEPADQAARHLLAYQERAARFQTPDLAQEFARLGDGNASPQAAMELALILGQTRNPADMPRALGVLDQVLRNPDAQAWHGLARLLQQRYTEQRRADEQAERLNQQLRDTQRDNQRRVDQLNQQLEALKAIERSLNARPGGAPAAPNAPAPAASRPAP